MCVAPVLRTCGLMPGGVREVVTLLGGIPQPNPDSPNSKYCAAARLGGRPCNFWDLGMGLPGKGGAACSPGATSPVNLTVNFYLYRSLCGWHACKHPLMIHNPNTLCF